MEGFLLTTVLLDPETRWVTGTTTETETEEDEVLDPDESRFLSSFEWSSMVKNVPTISSLVGEPKSLLKLWMLTLVVLLPDFFRSFVALKLLVGDELEKRGENIADDRNDVGVVAMETFASTTEGTAKSLSSSRLLSEVMIPVVFSLVDSPFFDNGDSRLPGPEE